LGKVYKILLHPLRGLKKLGNPTKLFKTYMQYTYLYKRVAPLLTITTTAISHGVLKQFYGPQVLIVTQIKAKRILFYFLNI